MTEVEFSFRYEVVSTRFTTGIPFGEVQDVVHRMVQQGLHEVGVEIKEFDFSMSVR